MRRTNYFAERRATDIAIHGLWSEELSVIEQIEGFQPKLQGFRFGQAHDLEQRHIVVSCSRTIKKTPLSVARCAEGILAEQRSVEIRLAIAGIVIQIETPGRDVRLIDTKVIDAIRLSP